MLPLKEFLREELRNATRLLGEALRFKHRREISDLFYTEISNRLELYSNWLESTPNSDHRRLAAIARFIKSQSELLARIERSHVGEFSWVFTENLESLAREIWKTLDPAAYPEPLFFICADPELSSYRIYPEQADPNTGHERPIFSIVYPRTLKPHILFHPILGHELGHPIYQVNQIFNEIEKRVSPYLLLNTPLQNDQVFAAFFARLGSTLSANEAAAYRASWVEELTCDLIGLLLMGPSFISAHNSLFPAFGSVTDVGYSHPVPSFRFDILRQAIDHLGWLKPTATTPTSMSDLLSTFSASAFYDTSQVPSLISGNGPNIPTAISELDNILKSFGGVTYSMASDALILEAFDKLSNKLPPGETVIDVADGQPLVKKYDFRDLIFVAWLYWYMHGNSEGSLSFYNLSRLCSRSLIQQDALVHWEKG